MLSKADRTKQFIIEKAAHVFNTKGYHGTSMGDLIEATGLAKGGIYGNFSSKEEIAVHAFEYAYEVVMSDIRIKVRAQKGARNKLLAILDYYKNYSIHSPIDGGCPVLNTSCDVDDTVPALKARVAKAVQKTLDELIALIEYGKEKGEFRQSVKSEELADLIYSQIEGGIMIAKISDNPKKLNRLLENLKIYLEKELKP